MDPHFIAEVLGALVVDSTGGEHPGYSLRLTNFELGVKLRLEVTIEMDEVRIFIERSQRHGPSFIGAITLYDVRSVVADMEKREVRFVGEHSELSVKRTGVFVVSSL